MASALRSAAAGLLVAGVLLTGSTLAGPAHRAAAETTPVPTPSSTAATDAGSVSLTLAPDNAGSLAPSQDLAMTVTIENTTAVAVPAGVIHLWLDRSRLATRTELSGWLDPATETPQDTDSASVDAATTAIAPGATASVRAIIPTAQIGLSAWGAYGVRATLPLGSSVSDARSAVVWSEGAPSTFSALGLIMPITVPPTSAGLLSAATLTDYTGSDGILTKKLDAVVGRPVTLAIDPMIMVSIRVLGTAAPQSALDWLARLAAAPNATFPLSYADSDLSIERQAGASTVLSPTSFDYALSASNFQTSPSPDPFTLFASSPIPTSTPATPGAPTPTPTPAPGQLPSFSDLTSWNYTRTDLAWPAANTVSAGDSAFFAQSGLTTSILSSDNVTVAAQGITPNAPASVDGSSSILLDAQITDALQTAADAATEAPRDAALAELSAVLTVTTGTSPGTTPSLAASLGRDAPASSFGVTRVLDVLEALPWASEVPLNDVLTAPQTPGISLRDSPQASSRADTVRSMLTSENQVAAFAPVIEAPELITGRQRASLLGVLAQSWAADTAGRTAAEASYQKASTDTLGAVQIVDGSSINLLASNGDVPVNIRNSLAWPVTVTLQVTPSNGRLVVEPNRIDITVEAQSQKTAKVPVKAAVASGEVNLRLELYNKNGVLVSQAQPLQINVSADWEGIGTLIIAVLAVAFLAFGIIRQIRKRRRARRA
ncbi:hypothetical protein KPL76_04530 [Subtercola sp. PAMC28395]|uniref:DUF6049 family protein n=1 Tax=Subtercola sp. PAMC28395 TaxID=2846775 RepID=UPI001C0DC518|nr:DUF6049 family protein [Subtercola sp. PAMC28395]QWT24651.1 hypothetical protein KPL76_04530 [Subtercola sp. PAMC28395]